MYCPDKAVYLREGWNLIYIGSEVFNLCNVILFIFLYIYDH